MSTTANSTTIISAIGARNRLQRNLDELTRAAAGANTLPADDNGVLFDLAIKLNQALNVLAGREQWSYRRITKPSRRIRR